MNYIDKLKAIKINLSKSKVVTVHNVKLEDQADTLANAFIDIEESMRVIINELLPKFYLNNLKQEEVENLIFEIGEEFRHIIYHIKDTKVYDYLKVIED